MDDERGPTVLWIVLGLALWVGWTVFTFYGLPG
jgi:hypothetical protein